MSCNDILPHSGLPEDAALVTFNAATIILRDVSGGPVSNTLNYVYLITTTSQT